MPESTPALPTLFDLVRARAAFFTDAGGEPYAELCAGDGGHVLRLRSGAFRAWVDRAWYERTSDVAPPEERRRALSLLEGVARYEGPRRDVHVRLAEHEGAVYLDLGGPGRHVARVDGTGWRIEERSPVAFARPPSLLPIPRPVAGGSIDLLHDLFPQLSPSAFRLVAGWLMGALRPKGPYPILILSGERGSGKSTLARTLKLLVDASRAPLRSMPKGERDLAIATTRAWTDPRREGPERLPRMADFARWVSLAEPALGWEPGSFARTYERHQSDSDLDAMEHDAVAPLVLCLPGLAESGRWAGTATEMWLALTRLAERAGPRPAGWPKAANKVARPCAPTASRSARRGRRRAASSW